MGVFKLNFSNVDLGECWFDFEIMPMEMHVHNSLNLFELESEHEV